MSTDNARLSVDLGVYLVTDPDARIGVVETVEAAVRGGVTAVQLRDKALSDADFIALGLRLHAILRPRRVPLIVNDRAHLVADIGADGLHVGQSDLDVAAARAAIGRQVVLGLSIETAGQLQAVDWNAVDYLGIGPVRATATKPDHAAPIGIDGFADICRAAPCPSVAIGGLTVADAPAVKAAGGAGLAVVSAICQAGDPVAATRALATAWRTA